MTTSEKLLNKVYVGVIGAVVTLLTQKLISKMWKLATGDEPPEPTDPEVPATTAFIWALASGVGVGAAQLATRRLQNKRSWVREQAHEVA